AVVSSVWPGRNRPSWARARMRSSPYTSGTSASTSVRPPRRGASVSGASAIRGPVGSGGRIGIGPHDVAASCGPSAPSPARVVASGGRNSVLRHAQPGDVRLGVVREADAVHAVRGRELAVAQDRGLVVAAHDGAVDRALDLVAAHGQ